MATKRRPMRNHRPIGLLSLLLALIWTGCDSSQSAVETRWRFVGGTTLALQTNAPALRDILALPESVALRGPLLSQAIRLFWQAAAGTTNAPAEALAAGQPLVADLLDQLSLGETLMAGPNRREFALAVSGDAAHAQVWQTAWPKFFAAVQSARGGTPGKPQVAVISGWIVAVSDATVITPAEALKTLALIPAEAQVVLHAEEKIAGWPTAVFSAAVRDGAVRSQLKLTFAESLPRNLPAWQVPPFVKDPLVQFGAARGITPWLTKLAGLGPVLKDHPPSQWFLWGYGDLSLRSYLAAVVADPEKLVARINNEISGPFKSGTLMGQSEYNPNQSVLVIGGLPMAIPLLAAVHTNGSAYATLGALPSRHLTNPPPPELLGLLQRNNLLVYDWEISPAVVSHWNTFFQLNQIVHKRPLNSLAPGQKWLTAATEKLGNSATEALVTGDHELTVTRKSSTGLSALELTSLAWALDAGASGRTVRTLPAAKAAPIITRPRTNSVPHN